MTARSRIAALLIPLAAIPSGCGWLASAGPAGLRGDTPRLSRAELLVRANAACTRRARALATLERPRSKAQSRAFFARVAEIERAESLSFAALRPPRKDEPKFARLLAASLELAGAAERFHAAVVRDDAHERRRALANAERVTEAYDRAARALGLACRQSV